MATENPGRGRWEFEGSDGNVCGEYLRATFVRGEIFKFASMTAIVLILAPFSAYVVTHPDQFAYDAWIQTVGYSPRKALEGTILVPACIFVLISTVPALALFGVPLLPGGCEAGGCFWPRLYRGLCRKRGLAYYKVKVEHYFASLERHPMQAVVGERSVRVTEPDGRKWSMALRNVRRAYRGNGLVVLETGERLPSAQTVVLDVSGMGRAERRRFYRILDGRLPRECKAYYMHEARPPIGLAPREGERDGRASDTEKDGKKTPGRPVEPQGRAGERDRGEIHG